MSGEVWVRGFEMKKKNRKSGERRKGEDVLRRLVQS